MCERVSRTRPLDLYVGWSIAVIVSRIDEPVIKDKPLKPLLAKAEERGFLTLDDLMEFFPEAEENLAELEDLFIFLSEEGIQVLYDDDKQSTEDSAQADNAEKPKAAPASRKQQPAAENALSEIASDDTISLYLKEMARALADRRGGGHSCPAV